MAALWSRASVPGSPQHSIFFLWAWCARPPASGTFLPPGTQAYVSLGCPQGRPMSSQAHKSREGASALTRPPPQPRHPPCPDSSPRLSWAGMWGCGHKADSGTPLSCQGRSHRADVTAGEGGRIRTRGNDVPSAGRGVAPTLPPPLWSP